MLQNAPRFICIKKRLKILIIAIIIGFLASILTYNAVLAADSNLVPNTSQNPQNSANLAPADSVKQTAQNWMQKAQIWLTEAAGKAYESARQAVLQEINRQINNQINGTENQAKTSVKSVTDIIKENIGSAVSKIQLFFINLKNNFFQQNIEPTPTS